MWTLYRKELLELVRDRKTLFFAIAMPLLIFPLIFGGIGFITAKQIKKAETQELRIAFTRELPEVAAAFTAKDNFKVLKGVDLSDIRGAIRGDKVDVVLVVPAEYDGKQPSQSQWQLYFNDASSIKSVMSRVEKALAPLEDSLKSRYAGGLGISEQVRLALAEPFVLKKVSVADKRESIGEHIGGFLPYVLFFTCLMGAMMPAIDLGAGEKERGTLETLLLSPVPRTQLVLGKFLVVFTTAVLASLLSVLSFALWGLLIGQHFAIEAIVKVFSSIGPGDVALVLLMLIPIAAIFASAMLTLSVYARSYKEAQNYMGMLNLPLIMPIVVAMLPGVTLDAHWALVPITNVALAIKEILKGTIDYGLLWLILASTLVIAGLLISFCVYCFRQEKVLFR
ncbi:ABC transporter permease [Gallaecimonas kandeliae]|uniref:ABC transporter permease n=1 Tax=Gallaecimonas kandeliae TaxID=3029055 RepID=UPI002649A1E9|nr:ABC transporter permease [Gallaecimonas kandeliae]WKE64014.1 ABC transporter permease [Gallaecimonas kandeliae]